MDKIFLPVCFSSRIANVEAVDFWRFYFRFPLKKLRLLHIPAKLAVLFIASLYCFVLILFEKSDFTCEKLRKAGSLAYYGKYLVHILCR